MSDVTPKIAKGFTKASKKLTKGVRVFALAGDEWDGAGYVPLPLLGDPNGEILRGRILTQPRIKGALILELAEQPEAGIDREYCEQIYAIAVLPAGETTAVIYDRVGEPDVPSVRTLRKWRYVLTRTAEPFTPSLSSPPVTDGLGAGDITPKIARSYDKAFSKLSPGVRVFALAADDDAGYTALTLPSTPNGEILRGRLLRQPNLRGALMLDVAEQPSEGIDREWLEQLYAVAVLEPGDTAAVIYDRVGAPDVPAIPTLRKWHYALTRTTQMFTLTPSFVPGVPVGVLPLAITRWPGYGG